MAAVAPTQEHARTFWTNAYWLDHCEGYRVQTSEGRLGFVEEIVRDGETGKPTTLVVRESRSSGLTEVSLAQVRRVRPEAEEIALG